MKQQSLPLDLPPGPAATTIAPPSVTPALAALAARLDPGLRLGTSSWAFPGWTGLLYARPAAASTLSRGGLSAYGRHPLLRTVGVDSGYYAPLERDRLARYAAQVPADFRFVVKAPALITDRFADRRTAAPRWALNPGFLDPARARTLAVAPYLAGLGAKAGLLLWQFPPLGLGVTKAPRRFAEALYRFLRALPEGPVYAVELRDPALLTPDLAAALRHGGAVAGLAAHPRLPPIDQQYALLAEAQTGPVLIRWLLRFNRGYAEARARYQPFNRLCEPDPDTRARVCAIIRQARAQARPVYVLANNKAEGSAPLSLATLAEQLLKGAGRASATDDAHEPAAQRDG